MNLKNMIGLGVAGNFAGHLEQAGEASDFTSVKVVESTAPKAVFPFYLPNPTGELGSYSFLSQYPISDEKLVAPSGDGDNLQMEPEICIIFDVVYNENNEVIALNPSKYSVFNDSSIRRKGAKKICEKKNWGDSTKGVGSKFNDLDLFTKDGVLNDLRIASFIKRDNVVYAYGVDSAVADYNYNYEKLTAWLIDKMNNQKDEGPMNNIHDYLLACGKPNQALITIGATRYTEFGQNNYLKVGDTVYVVTYNPKDVTLDEVENMVKSDNFSDKVIRLRQEVVSK